jgi:hypothetical protein
MGMGSVAGSGTVMVKPEAISTRALISLRETDEFGFMKP